MRLLFLQHRCLERRQFGSVSGLSDRVNQVLRCDYFGGNSTVALFIIRLTDAASTPGCFASVFSRKDWQAAHVIPVTGKVTFAVASLACSSFIPDVLDCLDDVLGAHGCGISSNARGAKRDILHFDTRNAAEGGLYAPDASVAVHAVDFQVYHFYIDEVLRTQYIPQGGMMQVRSRPGPPLFALILKEDAVVSSRLVPIARMGRENSEPGRSRYAWTQHRYRGFRRPRDCCVHSADGTIGRADVSGGWSSIPPRC